ncbi:hypothetical protein K7432_004282 [Basidiobolus ranarum]|uniref:PQ-loop repeat-containing protein 1 n=1 Tax=Basidiobolus ranarum TaxID=34480 RepID=A0ABR2WYG5_9FUNG
MTLETILDVGMKLAMIFGPIAGYVDQYFAIRRTKTSAGFSLTTCGILLISSILRVFFWLGDRFDTTLLYQSLVMIISQVILLEICLRYKADSQWPVQSGFWNWPTFGHYVRFLALFTGGVVAAYILFGSFPSFIGILGYLSMGIEATVPMPQAYFNYTRKSVSGFSIVIIGTWFLGDVFKTQYYYFHDVPFQFLLCGMIQLSMDCIICFQLWKYSDSTKVRTF